MESHVAQYTQISARQRLSEGYLLLLHCLFLDYYEHSRNSTLPSNMGELIDEFFSYF